MSLLHKRLVRRRPWASCRGGRLLDRDNWRCTNCGKAGRLEVHHRTPLKADPEQDIYAAGGAGVTLSLVPLPGDCETEPKTTSRPPSGRDGET